MRSATPYAAEEGPSSAGLFRARPGMGRLGPCGKPLGPLLAALLCDLSPSSAGWLAEDPEASKPPKRLSAIGGLQLLSATGGHRTGHQAAGNQRPCGGIEHPDPHPALIDPRRLELNANGEMGSHGKPGRTAPQRPHRGQTLQLTTRFPRLPSGCSWATSSISSSWMAAAPKQRPRETGPRRTPPQGGRSRLRAPKRCPPAPPAACGPPRGR